MYERRVKERINIDV